MAKIDHDRPFLRLKNSLDKTRKKEIAGQSLITAAHVMQAIDVGEAIHCALCDIPIRSSNIFRHASNVHGAESLEAFAEELTRRNELFLLKKGARTSKDNIKKLNELIQTLDCSDVLLNLDEEGKACVSQLRSLAKLKKKELSSALAKTQRRSSELENASIDKRAPFRQKVRRRLRKNTSPS